MLTRHPRPGEVKTRIAAELGADAALRIHNAMATHTLAQLRALTACKEARIEVRTDAAFVHASREWLGAGPRYRYQGEGDLGSKLMTAFAESFDRGDESVVVVGSDCPYLTAGHLRAAFAALVGHDLVVGPAEDGGYYLIGITRQAAARAIPGVFTGIAWGSIDVRTQTLNAAERQGMTVSLLETLADVDRAEDVPAAEAYLAERAIAADSAVSVVIPTLQEAAHVQAAVCAALAGGADEVIVADGGSTDGTTEAAAAAGARVVHSSAGRASQMNAGAAEARGAVLCFLHADTVLPVGYASAVRAALREPGVAATAFRFAVSDTGWRARAIALAGSLRWRLERLPYGDQTICVTAETFEALGGFAEIPALEDYEFSMRLARFGRIRLVDLDAVTSARTWTEHGLITPTLLNLAAITGFRLGVDPAVLASLRKRIAPGRQRSL